MAKKKITLAFSNTPEIQKILKPFIEKLPLTPMATILKKLIENGALISKVENGDIVIKIEAK